MTPNPQNADKFDVEEVERELKEISPWPWQNRDDFVANKEWPGDDYGGVPHILFFQDKCSPSDADLEFISKSPQRLAAAVERIRELEQEIERLKKYNEWLLKESPESLHISGNAMDIRLKSSDEE